MPSAGRVLTALFKCRIVCKTVPPETHREEVGTGGRGDADGAAVVKVLDPDVGIAPYRWVDYLQRQPRPVRGQTRPVPWLALGHSSDRAISRDGAHSHAVRDRHRHCGEQIGRGTQHRRVVRRIRPRGYWQRPRIPDEPACRGIEGPRLQLPVGCGEQHTRFEVSHEDVSESELKSDELDVDAADRAVGLDAAPLTMWPSRRRD